LNTYNISFKEHSVEVIYKPGLKNSYIRISRDGYINVRTSYRSKDLIYQLLNEKQQWIEKQLIKYAQYKQLKINLEDELLLFGEIYSIDSNKAEILRKKLHRLKKYSNDKILKAYDDFYKEIAKKYLTHELDKYAKIMNLHYNEVKFRKMKSRWGSCSSKKNITLNTQLMKLNKDMIAYVIVHELAHIVHMNHSKEFHSLVEYYLPNAKNIRSKLKESRVLT